MNQFSKTLLGRLATFRDTVYVLMTRVHYVALEGGCSSSRSLVFAKRVSDILLVFLIFSFVFYITFLTV